MARTEGNTDNKGHTDPGYYTMFMSELIGTALLMFLGCMGCIPDVDNPPAMHHMSSLSFGLVILLIIQGFGHISGAHLNPAVTIAAVLNKMLTTKMGVVFIVAQFIGAILGFALLKILIPEDYAKPGFCMTFPHSLITKIQALAIETIITTVLIIVVCSVWDKRNADKPDSVPLKFAFIVIAISMAAGPFSGASMNTARTFAPAVLEGNYKDQWIYWLGPNVGAVLGCGIYNYLFALKEEVKTIIEEASNLNCKSDINIQEVAMELLRSLIIVSEKAANIARVCRQHEHLFELLIQKKKGNEANPRFIEDFKTLADVLIQEMVKHDIKGQFQGLSNTIVGEETNVLENTLGVKICVEIKETEAETADLLKTILNEDQIAASLLAAEVHKEINIKDVKTKIPTEEFDVDLDELGVWIDPIDCTGEYINRSKGEIDQNIHLNGLKCVTVLIGVFNMTSGLPVMGVINRPFVDDEDFMSLKCVWGVSLDTFNLNSELHCAGRKNIICVSSSEGTEVKQMLQKRGYHLVEASGAGYKILTVILGLADAYVLTKGTTFKWDTCAPHSIIKSLGGDIVDFKSVFQNTGDSIKYFLDKNNCNVNGIIAYIDKCVLNDVIDVFKSCMN